MTIADIFSALAEDSPYRKGMEKEKVIMILGEDAQKGSKTYIKRNKKTFEDIYS